MNGNIKSQIPVITIILSVYNGGDYLKQSVSSVLRQTLTAFEFLVMDDCSTDDSLQYLEGIKDVRIKLFRGDKNRGLFSCLNTLISNSHTNLIKLWSQDDIMYSDCLEKVVTFHDKHPEVGFSYTGRDMINEVGEIRETGVVDNTPEIISTDLHARIAYFTGSIAGNIANVCINKNALDRVGLFNEQMKISADFDMWVRLAEHYETGFIREKLIQLRDHSGQLSRNEKYYINHVKEDLQVYRYLDGYVQSSLKIEGKKIMRVQKLNFYYTLMLKAILKGKVSTAYKFYYQISGYTSMLPLSIYFLKSTLFKMNSRTRLNINME